MPHLVVREPGQIAVSIPLHDGLRAGRHEQNDLVLLDHQVSRHHAEFARAEQGWEVRDLGSTHGVYLNGAKIDAGPLGAGDRIQIGNVLIAFADEEPGEIVHQQVTAAGAPPPSSAAEGRRLGLFYEVSRAIGATDADALLDRMLGAIVDVLGCGRAVAGLRDGGRGPVRQVVRRRGGAGDEGEVVVSRGMIDAMIERRQGIITRNAGGRDAPATLQRQRILSAMGAPLQAGARSFGFLYVDDQDRADRFTPADLDFLTALAHLTAAALEGAERYQKAVAEAGGGAATDELVGASPPMQRLRAQIQRYAAAGGANVVIRGESGTGKELVARALHAASPRAERPFVALNCAAIPETMIESELFGYEKGAFTGAARARKGKIALAHQGTLFLDEIGDLDLAAQAKLLRAIQEGEVQPLGAETTARVDVRFLAATHKDLAREIAERRFREDLFYRLAVVEIEVPPLREREGDVEALARMFLERAALGLGKTIRGLSPAATATLVAYRWPGNVRELRNEVERAAIHAESSIVEVDELSPRLRERRPSGAPPRGGTPAEQFAALESTERRLVEEALTAAQGNLSEAARLLGITRIMMRRRVDRFGLKVRDT
jgi:Nif-specific regulatory protein